MEENVKWDGTIFDGNKWQEGLSMEDRTPLFYFVSIIMYCISFVYLFGKSLPSTYVVYMFAFILNTVFPFIWISEFFAINPGNNIFVQRLINYRSFGVAVSLSIQFFSLFLVVLTNENIRKMKVLSVPSDQKNNRTRQTDMTKLDASTALAYKNITILFVTITTLIWGIVGEAFSENKIISIADNNNNNDDTKALASTIRWLLNQPYQLIYNFDTLWNNLMQRILVSPLVKAFSMYCATFLVLFFGMFVRIRHFKHPLQHNPIDRFNIVNIGPLFTPEFKRNVDKYRSLCVFCLSLMVSLCFAGLMFWLKSLFKDIIPKNAIIGTTLAGFALFFGCFFGMRKKMFPDLFAVKKIVYFLLCFIFTMVGTPVVLGGIQLLIESGLLNIFQRFCLQVYSGLTGGSTLPILKSLNTNGMLGGSALVISIVLLFTMFGLGLDRKWVVDADGKSMQMFMVTLITMTVSLFTALNTKYKVCTALYTLIRKIVEFVLVYLAPLTLVALASVQFVFSYKNYMKYKQYAKLKSKDDK